MKLYRIRRKNDGKCFLGLKYPWSIEHGHEGWSDAGAFYRDIDTIKAWLQVLCSDWKQDRLRFKGCGQMSSRKMAEISKIAYPENLELYEVIINNVTIQGEEIISAKDLLGISPDAT